MFSRLQDFFGKSHNNIIAAPNLSAAQTNTEKSVIIAVEVPSEEVYWKAVKEVFGFCRDNSID